jgi:AraC-like DNA-binding protein
MLQRPDYLRNSTEVTRDPFSDILQLADARSVVSGGFVAGGRWAIRFPPPLKIKFFGVVRGSCWLLRGRAATRLESGDVFLLSAPRGFVIAGDRKAAPVDASTIFTPGAGAIASVGEGDDCFMIGGHVQLDAARGPLLAHVLPPLVHVRATSPQASILHWLLDQLVHEQTSLLPGARVATAQLAQLMFLQILRAHVAEAGPLPAGWLRATSDPRIAPALRLMHGEPAHPWQLGELAKAAAMSRTTFAFHFKSVAGVAPLAYLTAWRMMLAQRALRDETMPVSEVARSLGYTSESAFSNAFKRVTGQAPRSYRSAARAEAKARMPADRAEAS